jgi:predicted metal-binding membrane protein
MRRFGLFGWAGNRDCLSYGINHAGWCIASCWAWMLVPLIAGIWHGPMMLLAAAIMLRERLSAPRAPRWRLPALHVGLAPHIPVVSRPGLARNG